MLAPASSNIMGMLLWAPTGTVTIGQSPQARPDTTSGLATVAPNSGRIFQALLAGEFSESFPYTFLFGLKMGGFSK